jgi:hypothetical protein
MSGDRTSALRFSLCITRSFALPHLTLDFDVMIKKGSKLEIPWSWVAAASLTVGLGALTTLAVIVSIKDVDTLSTVALALAVIAFAAQLVLALWQGFATQNQTMQMERVNSETQSLLSEVRLTTNGLSNTQSGQFDRLLTSILAVVPSAVHNVSLKNRVDAGELARDLTTAIRRAAIAELQTSGSGSWTPKVSDQWATSESLISFYNSYPGEDEGKTLIAKVSSLNPLLMAFLGQVAGEEINRIRFGLPLEYKIREGAVFTAALVRKGLAEYCPPPLSAPDDGSTWARLTSRGRDLIRVVVAPPPCPPWVATYMQEV